MWHSLRSLHLVPALSADPHLLDSQRDLLQSTLRFLIYATAGICAVIYILVNTLQAAHITSLTLALLPIVACSYLALQLASRQFRLAMVTWLGGAVFSITLAWALLQDP